jgi:uncharacterized protein involved in exopolysaccharide biosynthesis
LAKQARQLQREVEAAGKRLAQRASSREAFQAGTAAAQKAFEAASARLRDVRTNAAYAGERLKVVDAGIVPQKPSFPNIGLNCAAALGLALAASLVYLSIRFSMLR